MTQQIIKQAIMTRRDDIDIQPVGGEVREYVEVPESTTEQFDNYNYSADVDVTPRRGFFSRLVQAVKNLFTED